MGTPRQPSAVAAALLVLLSCTAFYPHSAAARKSKDKAEAERLAEAVREHGGAGRWPESIEASLQAIALDPTSRVLFSDFSFTLTQVRPSRQRPSSTLHIDWPKPSPGKTAECHSCLHWRLCTNLRHLSAIVRLQSQSKA